VGLPELLRVDFNRAKSDTVGLFSSQGDPNPSIVETL
jgi:hypothetical protein